METVQKLRKMLIGTVSSDAMDKTIVVSVKRTYVHPRLKKVMSKTKKYKVHDEQEQARPGDIVSIYEGRPVSKSKYMYLDEVIKSSGVQ